MITDQRQVREFCDSCRDKEFNSLSDLFRKKAPMPSSEQIDGLHAKICQELGCKHIYFRMVDVELLKKKCNKPKCCNKHLNDRFCDDHTEEYNKLVKDWADANGSEDVMSLAMISNDSLRNLIIDYSKNKKVSSPTLDRVVDVANSNWGLVTRIRSFWGLESPRECLN